ncbi:D-threo-aldose 1-dehydrogenase [Frondihabitans sp. PhB188]|uniref:aldo/keto reductase n=1 Tax=Frondihabitans sp. PhB188 TaxID=2485200 RepID=UPI000F48ABC7|nr:aldo/keto reductase [Frondihabitans sp. PhB188]ROQ41535.1 D-threo-aldose 1-dehydrogenase [Frondihabitans sp. PhB188]
MHELRPDWTRTLGSTGLTTTAVTIGGGPLGSQPLLFGYDTPEAQAVELVEAVLDSPIRSIDTSNQYSGGDSETRIGLGLAAHGGLPDDFLVVTKVDSIDGDYSGERVRASVAESKARLGLDTLPLVHLHDPENQAFEFMSAPGGAVETLVALRDEGEIGHIGLAGGPSGEMRRYIDLGVFEAILVHNRYTIVDRSAAALLQHCADAGLGIINAAVYGGGILAAPRSGNTNYGYRPAAPETLAAVAALADLCDEYETDLGTAALQWSLRDPLVNTTVVGISKPARLDGLLASSAAELPDAFWERAEELTPPARVFLDA